MTWPRGWPHHDPRSGSPTMMPTRLGRAGSDNSNSPYVSSAASASSTACADSITAPAYFAHAIESDAALLASTATRATVAVGAGLRVLEAVAVAAAVCIG